MQSNETPHVHDVVLVGGGHSHVGVVKLLAKQKRIGLRITLICTDTHTPYSGMLPGYIAGHYQFDEVHIQLPQLCKAMGVHFIHGQVCQIDRTNKRVICDNHTAIPYDVLSINIGATPQVHSIPGAKEEVVPVKPIAQFNQRWLALLNRIQNTPTGKRVVVVGGGAGGVELILSMQHRLHTELNALNRNPNTLQFDLFTSGNLLPTHNKQTRKKFESILRERGVHLHLNTRVTRVSRNRLTTADGRETEADEMIWVTQAGGASWLKQTGLELNEQGFIRVHDTLQTWNDPAIFAAGDVAHFESLPLEKAGVFAVRMANPLAHNLLACLQQKKLRNYRPQKTGLALISTGNQYAVANKGCVTLSGQWVWQIKDAIDKRFMKRYNASLSPTPSKNHLS